MKKLLVALTFLVSGLTALAGDNWLTNFDQAQKQATVEKKVILINFTGSDWCPWCVRLNKEVFSQKAFKEFAAKNLILVYCDFPRKKPMANEQKKMNRELAQKYKVASFPTILVVDSKGTVLGRTGYRRGGASKYVAHLKQIIKDKPAIKLAKERAELNKKMGSLYTRDIVKGMAKAARQKKNLLFIIQVTGRFPMNLEKNVLCDSKFKQYVANTFIPIYIDFSGQMNRAQRHKLGSVMRNFKLQGTRPPILVAADSAGKSYGAMPYTKETPAMVMARLNKIVKEKPDVKARKVEEARQAAAHKEWMTDFKAAKKRAQKENKPILIDFTGSDWCGWCIKLDKEVFSRKAFMDYARKNLILMVCDFPNRKQLPASVQKQNQKLAKKYNVTGYPTIILVDSNGKVIGRTGYQRGGAKKYVKHLKQILKK